MTTIELAQTMSSGTAARRLGVSSEWVRRLVGDGRLHPIVTPLGRLFDPAEIEALAAEREGSDRRRARDSAA